MYLFKYFLEPLITQARKYQVLNALCKTKTKQTNQPDFRSVELISSELQTSHHLNEEHKIM